MNLVTIGLVFFLTRDLFDSMTGAMAAVFYMLLSTSLSVFGTAAHATHFVTLFGVAGVWILWRASRSGNAWQFLAAGFLLGLALLMKQHGVFLAGFGGLTALLVCTRQRRCSLGDMRPSAGPMRRRPALRPDLPLAVVGRCVR